MLRLRAWSLPGVVVLVLSHWGSLCVGQTASSTTPGLVARWIPTDLNYPFIASLRNSTAKDAASQIAAYGTLGVVTLADVSSWLSVLINNPNARDGTVRWQPSIATKCSSGVSGCTKSIHVTILEFQYTNPNGSDCKASALLAADAILPPQSTLTDSSSGTRFMPVLNPITYQLTASPNSTASSCTYIIQYPPATQRLANSLCAQGNTSCTDSPCLPCNANLTFTSGNPQPENGCLPTSGVAPALVASIEGAAQCLASGGIGRFQCQVGFISNNSACAAMSCFPGDAQVSLANGKQKRMDTLQIGDKIQVVDQKGKISYEDVYFFGHKDREAIAPFVRLSLEARTKVSANSKRLDLSGHHFVYIRQQEGQSLRATRAKDVQIGNILQIIHGSTLMEAEVIAKRLVFRQGLWNPYTLSGRIVVNDVAVSAHSEWLLDPLLDYLRSPHLLPTIYQIMLWPVRILYHLIGDRAMRWLDNSCNFGRLLTSVPMVWSGSHTSSAR